MSDRGRFSRPPGVGYLRWRVVRAYGLRCHWCQDELSLDANPSDPKCPTVEHMIPICDGGSNQIHNLRIACRKCNSSRGKSSERFIRYGGALGFAGKRRVAKKILSFFEREWC